MTLQITACGTGDFLTAVSPKINSNPTTGTTNTNNRAAIISGVDSGSVIEDVDPDGDNLLEVSGKLDIIDSDDGEAAFIAKTTLGSYGNLETDANGNWNYAADNKQNVIQNLTGDTTLTDNLTVSSIDGTTHTIKITIIGVADTNADPGSTPNIPAIISGVTPNNPAIISGVSTGSVTKNVDPNNNNLLEVNGKLIITDLDAGEASFIATTLNGNYGNLTINADGSWNYAASNTQAIIQNLASGATLTDRLTINSIDGTAHTVTIVISGANENNITTNITLSWVAPVVREDNSALSLSAIAGYNIYYGTTQGQYTNSTNINDGSATSYSFNNFFPATYFFVITTIDTDGRESQYSGEIIITI